MTFVPFRTGSGSLWRTTHADEFIFLIDRLAAERENENAAPHLRPSPSGAPLLQFHRAIPLPRIRQGEIHKTMITQTNVRARARARVILPRLLLPSSRPSDNPPDDKCAP
jgi:hypothetical protein